MSSSHLLLLSWLRSWWCVVWRPLAVPRAVMYICVAVYSCAGAKTKSYKSISGSIPQEYRYPRSHFASSNKRLNNRCKQNRFKRKLILLIQIARQRLSKQPRKWNRKGYQTLSKSRELSSSTIQELMKKLSGSQKRLRFYHHLDHLSRSSALKMNTTHKNMMRSRVVTLNSII